MRRPESACGSSNKLAGVLEGFLVRVDELVDYALEQTSAMEKAVTDPAFHAWFVARHGERPFLSHLGIYRWNAMYEAAQAAWAARAESKT